MTSSSATYFKLQDSAARICDVILSVGAQSSQQLHLAAAQYNHRAALTGFWFPLSVFFSHVGVWKLAHAKLRQLPNNVPQNPKFHSAHLELHLTYTYKKLEFYNVVFIG